MRETTLAVSILVDMARYLTSRSQDADALCQEAGIDPALLTRQDERVPGGLIESLWRVAVDRTGDADLGLHMAEEFNPGTLDIAGYVMLNCRTAAEALERATRYITLINDGLKLSLETRGPLTICRCEAIETRDNYVLRRPREAMDSLTVGMVRQLRLLTGSNLTPKKVEFGHRLAGGDTEHRRFFQSPVEWGKPHTQVTFESADLERPIPSANPALLAAFSQHADGLLAELQKQGPSTTRQVRELLMQKLKGRAPSLAEVAREMKMSQRNLQRALSNEDTTYQSVLDDARRDLAVRHLKAPGSTVTGVAFLLGFSEASSFHRSFRRWTGQTPAAMRR